MSSCIVHPGSPGVLLSPEEPEAPSECPEWSEILSTIKMMLNRGAFGSQTRLGRSRSSSSLH